MKFTFKILDYILSIAIFETNNPLRNIISKPINIFVGKETRTKFSTNITEFVIVKYVSLANSKFKRLTILGKNFDIGTIEVRNEK